MREGDCIITYLVGIYYIEEGRDWPDHDEEFETFSEALSYMIAYNNDPARINDNTRASTPERIVDEC